MAYRGEKEPRARGSLKEGKIKRREKTKIIEKLKKEGERKGGRNREINIDREGARKGKREREEKIDREKEEGREEERERDRQRKRDGDREKP